MIYRLLLPVGLSCSLLFMGCDSGTGKQNSTPSPTATTSSSTASSTAVPTPQAELKSALQTAIVQYTQAQKVPADTESQFLADFIDLNGNGTQDAIVVFNSSYWCGTGGCTMLVFEGQKDTSFRLVSETSLVRPPITVSETTTNGWRDLVLTVSGGGMPAKTIALKFDGQKYPLNASDQPSLPANPPVKGTILFPEGTKPQTLSKATPQADLQSYDDPVMAIATKYPSTMAVDANCAGEGCGYFFKFKPQNNALDQAEVHIFLPAGARTVADAEKSADRLMQANGWKKAETAIPQDLSYPWVKKTIPFTADKGAIGYILVGETNNQGVQVTLLYPSEMSKMFMPAAKTILDHLQFKPDKLPITTRG